MAPLDAWLFYGVLLILGTLSLVRLFLYLRQGRRAGGDAPAAAAGASAANSGAINPGAADPVLVRSTSPDGRYRLQVTGWEAFNTLWVYSPEIIEQVTGETAFAFADRRWSLDQEAWQASGVVRLWLRKYPGNHRPGGLVVGVDLARRVGWIEAEAQTPLEVPLEALEAEMERGLTWVIYTVD